MNTRKAVKDYKSLQFIEEILQGEEPLTEDEAKQYKKVLNSPFSSNANREFARKLSLVLKEKCPASLSCSYNEDINLFKKSTPKRTVWEDSNKHLTDDLLNLISDNHFDHLVDDGVSQDLFEDDESYKPRKSRRKSTKTQKKPAATNNAVSQDLFTPTCSILLENIVEPMKKPWKGKGKGKNSQKQNIQTGTQKKPAATNNAVSQDLFTPTCSILLENIVEPVKKPWKGKGKGKNSQKQNIQTGTQKKPAATNNAVSQDMFTPTCSTLLENIVEPMEKQKIQLGTQTETISPDLFSSFNKLTLEVSSCSKKMRSSSQIETKSDNVADLFSDEIKEETKFDISSFNLLTREQLFVFDKNKPLEEIENNFKNIIAASDAAYNYLIEFLSKGMAEKKEKENEFIEVEEVIQGNMFQAGSKAKVIKKLVKKQPECPSKLERNEKVNFIETREESDLGVLNWKSLEESMVNLKIE